MRFFIGQILLKPTLRLPAEGRQSGTKPSAKGVSPRITPCWLLQKGSCHAATVSPSTEVLSSQGHQTGRRFPPWKAIYLAPYGSRKSHQRYQKILKQWEAERDARKKASQSAAESEWLPAAFALRTKNKYVQRLRALDVENRPNASPGAGCEITPDVRNDFSIPFR